MKEQTSYLDQLKFDPKLSSSFVAKYLTNFRLVALLLLTLVTVGIASFISLPRRLNPEVNIPTITVSTLLPGASPEDIESLVTIPIEDEVIGLEGVSLVSSVSQENVSISTVEFETSVDTDKAKNDVQNAVDAAQNELPEDAQNPQVTKIDFENQPVWTFSLSSSSDTASLMRFAENLKDKIENVPQIDKVSISGLEEQEIVVLIKPEAQIQYGISTQELLNAVRSAIPSYPAGTVNTQKNAFALTIDPTINSVQDLRDIRVSIGDNQVKLSQIATIQEHSKPSQNKSYIASAQSEAQRAVSFNVFKTSQANIDLAVENAQEVARSTLEQSEYSHFNLTTSSDLADLVGEQFEELAGSFRFTIALVFLVLFVFIGIRQALIVSLVIPLAFLSAFAVMNVAGLSLNFLSLFSLILSLGLLVDTAIVVVTAITRYYKTGKFTSQQAGLLVLKDFTGPIFATSITTVWAFTPMLLSSGIIGEFIKSMPIVVTAAVLSSATISLLITLPLMMVILKPKIPSRLKIFFSVLGVIALFSALIFLVMGNPLLPIIFIAFAVTLFISYKIRAEIVKNTLSFLSKFLNLKRISKYTKEYSSHGIIDVHKFALRYQKLIDRVLTSQGARRKTIAAVIIFSLFSYLLVPLGFVENEFFPSTDQDQIFVSVELPPGTNLDTATEVGLELVEDLRKQGGVDFVTVDPGTGFDPVFFGPQPAENNILFNLVLKEEKERDSSIKISQELRNKFANFQAGSFSVIELSGGPPAGADLLITLLGEDSRVLDENANRIIDFLENLQGAENPEKSIAPGTSKLVFVPEKDKLASAQISESQLGAQLRTYASGITLDTVKFNGDEQDITFRQNTKAENPETLSQINIQTQIGNIPLTSLGDFVLKANPTQITREDGKRTISVAAEVLPGFTPPSLNAELENFARDLDLPTGYEWKTGGVNEENQESANAILQAMVVAAILILATMVILLGSYRKAVIVLLVIPLAISGVFIIFAITGTPLSFPTLVGLLALFGIVVNNSILVVDKINQNLNIKMRLKQAISDASASRVEPIFFSSLTTIVGLTPITLSDPLWQGLGGAIIAGLIFSGTIMLLFIPVVYYMIFKGEIK